MFKVENDKVEALSSSSVSFDNIVQTQKSGPLVNIPIKEFPPSGFM
jgi:hypothetical protein